MSKMRHDRTCLGIDEMREEVHNVMIDPDDIGQVNAWLYEHGIYRNKKQVYAEIYTIRIQGQEYMIYCDDSAMIDGEAHALSAICTDADVGIYGPLIICRLNEDRSEALPLREKDRKLIMDNIRCLPNPILLCKKRR